MATKTLPEIFLESARDAKFRGDLLDDHQKALDSKGFQLSSEDMSLLNDIMAGDVVVSPSILLEAFGNVATGSTFPIPPSWKPFVPPLDVTQ